MNLTITHQHHTTISTLNLIHPTTTKPPKPPTKPPKPPKPPHPHHHHHLKTLIIHHHPTPLTSTHQLQKLLSLNILLQSYHHLHSLHLHHPPYLNLKHHINYLSSHHHPSLYLLTPHLILNSLIRFNHHHFSLLNSIHFTLHLRTLLSY